MQPYDFPPQMMDSYLSPQFLSSMVVVVVIIIILELVLKGLALWRAARMNMPGWFVALLLINSVGLFPLLFLILTYSKYEPYQALQTSVAMKKAISRKPT